MMRSIKNPILRGFNPDPSILRVGDDYYIATSTFEWFPGVQIHHSRDLVHWKLVTRPLRRVSQLDLVGNPNSCGIWAPCLSFHEGTYYLIYTDVKCFKGIFKDSHNYLVTTRDIAGDWSEPIHLNSSGFDPSLFHDDDGRKWLVNMIWDHRKGKNPFSGIILQEFSAQEKRLVGPIRTIFKGTCIGITEGPHLYKRNGYYYLLTAEGGTGINHAVTMARSESIAGPYEVDPANPVLTSADDPTLELQRAGHASLVETQKGEWYMAHLCGRPLPSRGRCVLGRETSIQKVEWTPDGWLRLANGNNKPQTIVEGPELPERAWEPEPARDDFDSATLGIHYQSLRVPLGEDTLSLGERPGFLRLKGRESPNSYHHQALVARRQQSYCYTASTCLEFEPASFQEMAGLICLYDNRNFYYIHVTWDEELGKCIDLMASQSGRCEYPLSRKIGIDGWKSCYFRADVRYDRLEFSYSKDGSEWTKLPLLLDASTLSDEFADGGTGTHFTGAFVGLCCQDLSGRRKAADFDFFEYLEK
jgi:xylan 1,4-beta-xylosidase